MAVMIRQFGAILALALAFGAPAGAQVRPAPPPAGKPIAIGASHSIDSKILNGPREITIRLPASYAGADKPRSYPVLYLLDGGADQDFPHIAGLAQHAEMSGTYDEFILVGIASTKKRIWELTFPAQDQRYVTFYRANGQPVEFASGGGSEAFRRFIAEEVRPFVESNYRTGGRRMLMGESLAAFFVVDTLLRQPRLFDDYIAISPSMWWNREELGERAAAMLRANDYSGKRLYLTMASEGGTMQRGLDSLLAALRTPAAGALKWTYVDRRNSEHHGSIYHVAALDALRTLYPRPWRPGSPLPWSHIGEMPELTAEQQADKKVACTTERARPVTFAEVNADPRKWEAYCVLPPLGQAPEPRERSANWNERVAPVAAPVPPRPPGIAPAPFLVTVKRPVAVISLLSAGRLEIVDGCVTASLRGRRYTAVFPPGSRLVRDGGSWSAVRYEGRSLAIGSDVGLPGGGARVAGGNLARPIPARCPKGLFVIGG
jgi:predicted alpha/beta superfamily hydrolase